MQGAEVKMKLSPVWQASQRILKKSSDFPARAGCRYADAPLDEASAGCNSAAGRGGQRARVRVSPIAVRPRLDVASALSASATWEAEKAGRSPCIIWALHCLLEDWRRWSARGPV